jgi:hypothetical protein
MFLDSFDVLMLKINLKKLKNIILIYFQIKNTLKISFFLSTEFYQVRSWSKLF